ncbi:hypothetical protein LMH87_001755 [Akanthomyces muscarius]|uniref:Ankyrin repeat protein n=1 Tax=Akanthomyces muscarius TaxID=2231603 RepID=A0A9W8UIJ5_AKAMU|nr:hypothetical protein LMH87_001755 [Akanthomyces muscarius]KAJ4147217.1 hypothetical protein LMH87_001755 [Akanthomyces muscarius]
MLVAIASFLGNTRDISCLARTNRRAYEVLDRYLYRFDVKTAKYNPKAFRFTCYYSGRDLDIDSITKRSLDAGADINSLFSDILVEDEDDDEEDEEADEDNEKDCTKTAIYLAATSKNLSRVQMLIEAGANINSTCTRGKSVLVYAIEANSLDLVRLVLAQPDIDLKCAGRTRYPLLLTAVVQDSVEIAKTLLPLVDPNQIDCQIITPLRMAVWKQNYEMVALLPSDDRTTPNEWELADVKAALAHPGINPSPPIPLTQSTFGIACGCSSLEIVKLLHNDDRTHVDFSYDGEPLPALFAFYQEQGGNADFLVRSTKSKKARNAIFLEACESIDYKYAVDILALAADDDRKHAERWAEAASAEGWKDLAAAVAAKWNAA